ncbi:ubiquitin-specific protease doa4 [Coemansia sp. RSA 2618]|nr:ubiquitin-specific protease doa4 [Coemansia sp. RSA 2618]
MSPELPEFDEKLAGSESIGMFDEDVAEKLRSQAASRAESNASSATDLSSMLSYHAPADGRPRPPAYQPTHTSRSQSRGSVNSNDTQDSDPVLDFMQRNGGICPPQQGSRRPTAQNSTPAGVGQVPAYKGFAEIDLPLPVATAELRPRHRPPPPLPLPVLPVRPQLPPQTRQPTSFSAIRNFVGRAPPPNAPLPYRPSVPLPVHTLGSEYGDDDDDMYDQRDEPLFTPNGTRLYSHHNAVGSDPALSGRMQSGSNPRSSAAYEHSAALSPGSSDNHAGGTFAGQSRRISQISDSGVFGVTGLKNFGNTCFMNSVIQCLIGTKPLTRYFMRGEWRKDLVKDNPRESDVTSEFSKVVESMWRGQYSSISPADFRASVAKCSEQFRGNEQEDAHEFASFLLNTLHETLNHRHPKPPPEKERTFEEELEFEQLSDEQQSDVQWELYTRRNHSIVTSIFQGQIQSRLTCMACQHTSTTYHTFTELSVPIPEPGNSNSMGSINGNSMGGINGPSANTSQGPYALPVNIYQCLDAYSETELLDGDNMWMCPQCKTKRTATKQLMIARLPLVLIIHLKRFSTIGHFREKLETNVLIPTLNLCLQKYVTFEPAKQSTTYNLYAVANHFGSMSSGHYTASVSDGMDSQWNSFDDTRASQIHESQVTTPAAYLLFFVRTRPD